MFSTVTRQIYKNALTNGNGLSGRERETGDGQTREGGWRWLVVGWRWQKLNSIVELGRAHVQYNADVTELSNGIAIGSTRSP